MKPLSFNQEMGTQKGVSAQEPRRAWLGFRATCGPRPHLPCWGGAPRWRTPPRCIPTRPRTEHSWRQLSSCAQSALRKLQLVLSLRTGNSNKGGKKGREMMHCLWSLHPDSGLLARPTGLLAHLPAPLLRCRSHLPPLLPALPSFLPSLPRSFRETTACLHMLS